MLSCSGHSNKEISSKNKAQIATEMKMVSWQGRLLKIYLRIKRFFHPPTGELDIETKRAELEALGRKIKPTNNLQFTAVVADSVQPNGLSPPVLLLTELSSISMAEPIAEAPLILIALWLLILPVQPKLEP
jgi:hypothetical protein